MYINLIKTFQKLQTKSLKYQKTIKKVVSGLQKASFFAVSKVSSIFGRTSIAFLINWFLKKDVYVMIYYSLFDIS